MEDRYSVRLDKELRLLEVPEENACYIGRKSSLWKKYGPKATLFMGRIVEENPSGKNRYGQRVSLDSMSPHVIYICGSRGSGKSYLLGVLAEEIALKNPGIAAMIVDTVGVFWSMKYPNQERSEVEALESWGLEPRGIENLQVFVPEGYADKIPKESYDHSFTLKPAELNVEDWCLTFGIDRYSPGGLILDLAIKKVMDGYTSVSVGSPVQVRGKGSNFNLDDLIACVDSDREITSKRAGFKPDSRRALISKLNAAKAWGIFGGNGTPIHELVREGKITVLDVSFLDENVRALVVGIFARKLLAARTVATRRRAVAKLLRGRAIERLEEIPPTWLFIDEAHVFLPAGEKKTAASDALVEFVKQGRRPGLSAVLATQQPSAVSAKVASQVDIAVVHRLIFDDDIKAVVKRMPTVLPEEFKKSEFFKSLPIGVALIGDKETSRAFVGSIRPRLSQHEGREAVAEIEKPVFVDKMAVWSEAREAILSKLRETSGERVSIQELSAVIQKLGEARGVEVPLDSLLADLRSDGILDFDGEEAWIPREEGELPPKPEVRPEPRGKIIQAIPFSISQDAIRRIAEKECRRRYVLFGDRENPASFRRMYYPLISMMVDYYPPKGKSINLRLYLDGLTREILLERRGGISRSHGLRALAELKPGVREVFAQLGKKEWMNLEELCRWTKLSRARVTAAVRGLETSGLLEVREDKGYLEVRSKVHFKDLPEKLSDKRILRVAKLPAPVEVQVGGDDLVLSPSFGTEGAQRAVKYWDGVEVVESKLVYYPHWRVVFADVRGPRRVLVYDGLSGKREKYVEEMVRERSG